MPGNEIIGKEEFNELKKIFTVSNGVLFAHAFDKRRKGIFRIRIFEKKLANFFRTDFVQCVSSGTAAIKIALKAIGVKPGDEVITQGFNFIATIEAILDVGAVPIITNIDDTLNMCTKDLKKKISSKTKAVIPVHMLGFSADMEKIKQICKKKKIPILEDNCESVGAKFKNKFLGTLGDVGVLSFDFGKNITTGEGGAILTNKQKIFKYSREYHDHGHELNPKLPRGLDTVKIFGFNYRMTEMQGAIGIAQLKKLNFILRENKLRYKILENLISKKFKIRKKIKFNEPSYDTFMFEVDNSRKKKKIINFLKKNNIGTKNVPDALKWHFATYWKHAIKKSQINSLNKSAKKIHNYIAIPILIKKNISIYKKIGNYINKI